MVLAYIGKKGQVSIEFILIVTIALIYINVSVWPTIEAGSQIATEVKAVADTKIAAMKLAGSLNEAFLSSGDMKKTIGLGLPKNGKITCGSGDSSIGFETQIIKLKGVSGGGFNPDVENCVETSDPAGWTCSSSISLLEGETLPQGCAEVGGPMEGPVYREMIIEKKDGAVSFYWK